MSTELESIRRELRDFARERDWERFHSPKNLAAALCVEAGELLEHFQWVSEEGSRSLEAAKRAEVAKEVADVFIYLLQLDDKLEIDLLGSAQLKIQENSAKYPVALARGNMKKYDEL